MQECSGARLLAYVIGLVNQGLPLQNEYIAAENRILQFRFPPRSRLSDPERSTFAEIGKRLGRSALQQVSLRRQTRYDPRLVPPVDCPQTRRLRTARRTRAAPIARHVEALIVCIARKNPVWDATRMSKRWPIPANPAIRRWATHPSPRCDRPRAQRSQKTTWEDFIASHMGSPWPAPTSSRSKCSPGEVSPSRTGSAAHFLG